MLPVSPFVVIMASASLVSGLGQAISLKWQNRQRLPICDGAVDVCPPAHFTQAFLQTAFMFVGECICLVLYSVHRWVRQKQQSPELTKLPNEDVSDDEIYQDEWLSGFEVEGERRCPWWWWTTPAPLDFIECALCNVATTITYASTVQMLHNFMVIASAVFSVAILRKPLKVHEWLGCTIVTAALILTGVPALTHPEAATANQELHWLGIIIAILSTCVHALQNIWEERLFLKGRMSSVLAVGIEGATGFAMSLVVLPLIHLTRIENLKAGFYQLSISKDLRSGMFWYSISSFANNATGVVVTKWTSGLLRCLFMSMRPPVVWAIEMSLGWNQFDFYNLAAMILLFAGLAVHLLAPPFDRPSRMKNVLCQEVPCVCLTGAAPPLQDHSARKRQIHEMFGTPQSELVKFGATPRSESTLASPFRPSNKSPQIYVTDLDDVESFLRDEETSRLSEITE
eukprot:Gregarina_sp_Pseudo_9__5908@NODE_938_length_2050_cov_20_491795_g880_i0_p1_GENE_NODE_938_length_2050_cov_20_491795_g880_i0NODE_938_length_2050_cov_20_491795_g880_i0_p1_ORF_typecomplete_len456_score87_61CRTlike/PF08627_10/9_4e30CRTlike/PF08627_10/37SLC35F/PF06027_12/7_6e27Nuc_sug_transp/PF04142_15/1_3e25Nuc_sug_transp/PF04142_15/1_4e03TPT/PF03151_16/1_3e16UAA/PF08449_11/1_8e15PUNUT/PF16913_5/2_3e07EamA/PF00892_20/4_4e05EamA/PF00892_20/3_3Mg_trans_NIPA/PF05653_14/3_2e03Mg_trans_NIPA/PF05653_14/0_00